MSRSSPALRSLLAAILCTCLVSALTVGGMGTKAAAQTAAPEPKKGTGKIVGGIMAIVGGVAVGGLVALVGTGSSSCDDDDYEDDDDGCRYSPLVGYGLLTAGAGVAVGVPLIVSGARDRKAWKTWRQGIAPTKNGGVAATFALDI